MATTWIVAADESRARVLQVARPEQRLLEIEDLLNPQARLPDRDLQSDAEPRFKARVEQRFDELVLVAPPKFLGALRKELDKEVERLVTDELPKDLSWFSGRDLESYFTRQK
jgi:protein required for attachment to host cells